MQETDTSAPIHVETAADLDSFANDHDRVLVEFYTEGCGVCASMEPILGIVASETDVPVVLVNPRDDPVLIEAYDIQSVPTLVLFERGAEVKRLAEGFVGAERLIEFVEG